MGTVLSMGGFLVGLLCTAFSLAVVKISPTIPDTLGIYIFCGLFTFLIGLIQFFVLAEVITSGVSTTFVCLAEDPGALYRTKPALYQSIRQVYPNLNLF